MSDDIDLKSREDEEVVGLKLPRSSTFRGARLMKNVSAKY